MADNLPSGTEFRAGRADSTSSSTSTGTNTSSSATGSSPGGGGIAGWASQMQKQAQAAATHAQAPAQPHRRPSHPLFETLQAQKRSSDPAAVARRQSMNEQRPSTGFIGQMWNNWVRGNK
jgi:hypothetical protein